VGRDDVDNCHAAQPVPSLCSNSQRSTVLRHVGQRQEKHRGVLLHYQWSLGIDKTGKWS